MSEKTCLHTGKQKKSGGGGNRTHANIPENERPIHPFSGSVSIKVNALIKSLKAKGLKPLAVNIIIYNALIEAEKSIQCGLK